MELKFNVDIKSIIPESISFNYEELDTELTGVLAKYTGTKVTEENIKECKDIRARINKLVKSFKDERTSLKKQLFSPLEDFSSKIDLLVGKCNMVSGFIDEGIKRIEDERKAEKSRSLWLYFIDEIAKEREVIGHDIGMSGQWGEWFNAQTKFLNATMSEDNCKLEMLAKIREVKDAVAVLRATYPVAEEYAKSLLVFARVFNLASTIEEMTQWKNEQSKIATPVTPATAEPQATVTTKVTEYKFSMDVIGTRSQLKSLADFLAANGIKFNVTSKMEEVK